MGEDYDFSSMKEVDENDVFLSGLSELNNLSQSYPELIYDGPFSDGQDRKQIKGLTDSVITSGQAQDIFKATFAHFALEKVKQVGESDAGIQTFNFEAEVEGESLYAQISKRGGKLIMFDYAGSCEEVVYQDDVATQTAQEFISSLGIKNMKPVWRILSNNVYTINFAYETEGVIVYSDLIKVRVCAQTNKAIGLEATSYWSNHVERAFATPKLSRASAKDKVWKEIQITSSRLAIVPIGNSTEKLCYEFCGEYNEDTYYVYIDAISGRQVEMFKVVRSTEGELLM
jgi:germination protein YpeB